MTVDELAGQFHCQ